MESGPVRRTPTGLCGGEKSIAERRKASSVAGTCSGTAEDIAVQRMPREMLSGPGKTLWNVAGSRWKSQQPGDAVRRQAEDRTMVGGGAGDRSGGGRRVVKWKTHLEAEDASEGGGRIWRRKMHRKAEDASEGGRHIGRRSRVRDGKAWHKGIPLTGAPGSEKKTWCRFFLMPPQLN